MGVCALGLHRGSQHHAVHGHIHLLQGLVLQSPPIGPHLGHTWVTPGSHLGHTWATPGSHLGHTWVTPWTQDALNIWIFILNVMFLCSGRSTSHNNNPTASSCGWACSAGLHWDPRVVWAAWARRGESEYHTPSHIEHWQVMGGGSTQPPPGGGGQSVAPLSHSAVGCGVMEKSPPAACPYCC